MEKPGKIYERMCNVMAKISAVGKSGTNQGQGYKFRKVDDVMDMLYPILAEEKIFILPKVLNERFEQKQTKSGTSVYRIITMEYSFCTDDGSFVTTSIVGEGMDTGDKAGNKALAGAYKYDVCQVFCIPTSDFKDSENDSHELSGKSEQKKENTEKKDAAIIFDGSFDLRKRISFSQLCFDITKNKDQDFMILMSKYCEGTPVSELSKRIKTLMTDKMFNIDLGMIQSEKEQKERET